MTPICVPPWSDDDARLILLSEIRELVGDFLLVGAHARDILCREISGLERGMPRTQDLDIAIAVEATGGDYKQRVAALDPTRFPSALRFAVPSLPDVPVDVIPCGSGVPDPQNIPVDRDRSLDATGMAEAMACRVLVQVHPDLTVAIPPLHAAIALKLIAHDLRVKLYEYKDARDLNLLFDAATGRMAEHDMWVNAHLLPQDLDLDVDVVGPWLVGARMRADFGGVLERLLDAGAEPRLAGLMAAENKHPGSADSADRRAHLSAMRQGLEAGDVELLAWPPTMP